MKLDLLYEFQPKIGPYDKPFPYGLKQAEQATYDEALEEIRWSENDIEAKDVPERQKGAAERLEAARRKAAGHRAQVEALRRELDGMPAE